MAHNGISKNKNNLNKTLFFYERCSNMKCLPATCLLSKQYLKFLCTVLKKMKLIRIDLECFRQPKKWRPKNELLFFPDGYSLQVLT